MVKKKEKWKLYDNFWNKKFQVVQIFTDLVTS